MTVRAQTARARGNPDHVGEGRLSFVALWTAAFNLWLHPTSFYWRFHRGSHERYDEAELSLVAFYDRGISFLTI